MTANQDKPISSLGSDFEVIEDAAPAAAPAADTPAGAVAAAPAPGASPYDPPFGPIRSANAWGSMGLVIAVAGLLGPWADSGGDFIHGLLLAFAVWFLIRGGFLAVQRTGATMPMILPVAMIASICARPAAAMFTRRSFGFLTIGVETEVAPIMLAFG